MVEPIFTKSHIDNTRPKIQETVDKLLDKVTEHGGAEPFDIVEEFALPVPSYVGILGVPLSDLPYLTQQAAIRGNGSATATESSQANASLLSYIDALVDKRLQKSENDLISLLVDNQLKAGRLQKADVTQIAFLLLVAGNATMISMIALGIVTALQHPEQLEDLRSEPEKWSPKFVEELCRYHTASALATKRVAKEDINLGGKLIKKGEGIIAATQSGNRDEEVFPNPDVVDLQEASWSQTSDPL
ncbi:putative Cytochrome 55A3 [Glarea lozoyensis 74030]|uniref:Putative Cytochrome 55A3 n=1 Tax=Glarea lozoyensis (strain ATCC 74030 / MF5533) TaxID=1104152 RepID=H0ESR1_GLAL7|nr:putative Cytochrome 55A3 [Glarea lozoyensis 74030]